MRMADNALRLRRADGYRVSALFPVFLCTEEARLDSSVRFGAAVDETRENFWRLPPRTKATESMLDEPGSQEWKSRIMRDSVDA
jgi:hypothetical protein